MGSATGAKMSRRGERAAHGPWNQRSLDQRATASGSGAPSKQAVVGTDEELVARAHGERRDGDAHARIHDGEMDGLRRNRAPRLRARTRRARCGPAGSCGSGPRRARRARRSGSRRAAPTNQSCVPKSDRNVTMGEAWDTLGRVGVVGRGLPGGRAHTNTTEHRAVRACAGGRIPILRPRIRGGPRLHPERPAMISGSEALARLREATAVSSPDRSSASALVDHQRRLQLVSGQEPFAIILGCSISRVPRRAHLRPPVSATCS